MIAREIENTHHRAGRAYALDFRDHETARLVHRLEAGRVVVERLWLALAAVLVVSLPSLTALALTRVH